MNIINDALVDKLFKDPPKMTKEIPLLSEKTVSGDGMVVINDAYSDFPIKNLTLQGNTKQDSTTGKNLIDDNLLRVLDNYKIQTNVYYVYRIEGLITGRTYTISRNDKSINKGNNIFGISVNQEDYQKSKFLVYDGLTTSYNLKSITWTQTVGNYADIIYSYGGVATNTTQERLTELFKTLTYVQLEESSTVTPYEPYTGGKPSPSPEYPQEIKSGGKWNEEKQKYEVEVMVTGKNLFDKEYAKRKDAWKLPDGGYTYIPIYVGKGKRITVSTSGNPKIGLNFYCAIARTTSKTNENVYTWIYHSTTEKLIKTKATFSVTESDYIYFSLSGGVDNIEKFLSAFPDFQIEYGEERTDYEPYKEQTLTLTSDRPITKWDKLVEQDGQIGWLYGSKIYVVTGNEVFESRDGYNIESYTNRYFILNDLLMDNDVFKPLAYMKRLRHKQYVYAPNIFEEGFETNKNKFHIKFLNERVGISTSDDNAVRTLKYSEYIKNIYKSGEPIEILYATKNKEFVPLPQAEQDAIRALKTYYPTTVVTVDGGELPVGIEVTYMHPEYIPTKQSALRMWFKENPII